MIKIKNKKQLIENGKTAKLQKARMFALESLECAVNAVDPKQLMLSKLVIKDSCLRVDEYLLEMTKFNHVFVVGGGKAGAAMAQTIEELLGTRITAGIVNVPYGTKSKTRIVDLNEASHPVPDQAGVQGTLKIMKIADQAQEDDLVICLISGGGSSLMPMPREGVLLEDKKNLTEALLKSGANIQEINIIRKHLSSFKGGWLAKTVYPATLLNLILSDVMGDPVDSIASGPTVADPSTFNDAYKILQKYDLWEDAPASIRTIVSQGIRGLIPETPKPGDACFKKVFNVIVGNNKTARLAANDALKARGLNVFLMGTLSGGEAKNAGTSLTDLAKKIVTTSKPVSKPAGILAGGETIVKVVGRGMGGRNQELTLSASMNIKNLENCVIASLSTDGVDGPTDAAGAIADERTWERAGALGMKPEAFLADNNSYNFFTGLNDLIFTGATGTNVNDITVIVLI